MGSWFLSYRNLRSALKCAVEPNLSPFMPVSVPLHGPLWWLENSSPLLMHLFPLLNQSGMRLAPFFLNPSDRFLVAICTQIWRASVLKKPRHTLRVCLRFFKAPGITSYGRISSTINRSLRVLADSSRTWGEIIMEVSLQGLLAVREPSLRK